MPRGGSKKGEYRGNAKRRTHPTPGDVLRDAVSRSPASGRGQSVSAVERRIEVARIIHGRSADVRDMTPREVLLDNMHFSMQAAYDWQNQMLKLASAADPDTMAIAEAGREVERLRALASEDAYRVAPFVHPRLAAVMATGNAGTSDLDVVAALLEDIDARQRAPRVIEHEPSREDEDEPK